MILCERIKMIAFIHDTNSSEAPNPVHSYVNARLASHVGQTGWTDKVRISVVNYSICIKLQIICNSKNKIIVDHNYLS
jgi:hypothetical protein